MSSSVNLIKEKLDIADVISGYIKLEKAGLNMKAKCPFHNEKTPSFFISPDRGTYYCFGCGAKGDIFTFVQEFEGLDFRSALKVLALRAGVELEPENVAARTEKDKLFSSLEQAVFFFEKHRAQHTEATQYLLKRGLTEETIKEWRIGYAPLEWRELHDFLLEKGFTKSELEKVGLIKKSGKREGDYYDVFRGRIMFPIFDQSGKVIAFSGRILVDDTKSPKYLNTPETVLFNKSETLYGLHKAKVDIRRKDYSILVEGQMDLVMAHQAGFSNTVASSGTAFTREHLEKLRRLSNRIIMAFDADGAGFTAANKSAQLALSLGMEVKIAPLPKGSDPAELIKTNMPAWTHVIKNSMHIIDFYMNTLLLRKPDPRVLGKEIKAHVLPYINMLSSSIERSHFVSKIAEQAKIKEDAVWEDLKTATPSQNQQQTQYTVSAVQKSNTSNPSVRKHAIERKIIGIHLWQREKNKIQGVDSALLMERLEGIIGKDELGTLLRELEPQAHEIVFEVEAYYDNSETLLQDIEELFVHLEEERLKEVFTKKMTELSTAEKIHDTARVEALLLECQELSKKIALLPKRK